MLKERLLRTIDCLNNGIDPLTGETFEKEILTNDPDLSHEILKLVLTTQTNVSIKKNKGYGVGIFRENHNLNERRIFEELKKWRLGKAKEKALPAYCILDDVTLWHIVESKVKEKQDLLFVRGIGKLNYDEYGDEIFELLSNYY